MVNDVYRTAVGDYALGGLINGIVDGLIIARGPLTTVSEITFDDGSKITLSSRYSLVVDITIHARKGDKINAQSLVKTLLRPFVDLYKLIRPAVKKTRSPLTETISVELLRVGHKVLRSDASLTKIIEIKKRSGCDIVVPRRLINLNDFLVVLTG